MDQYKIVDYVEDGVEWGMEHMTPDDCEYFQLKWEEDEVNYRLQSCDTTYYAIFENKVIAHLGLSDNEVRTVYVEGSSRGNGVAILLYQTAVKDFGTLFSDELSAQESGGRAIWEKLQKLYPQKVTLDKKKKRYKFTIKD